MVTCGRAPVNTRKIKKLRFEKKNETHVKIRRSFGEMNALN